MLSNILSSSTQVHLGIAPFIPLVSTICAYCSIRFRVPLAQLHLLASLYQVGAWIGFTIMTQSVPGVVSMLLSLYKRVIYSYSDSTVCFELSVLLFVEPPPVTNPFMKFSSTVFISSTALLFTLAGFYQMVVWAKGKHRRYKAEFDNYPRRKAIIPFIL